MWSTRALNFLYLFLLVARGFSTNQFRVSKFNMCYDGLQLIYFECVQDKTYFLSDGNHSVKGRALFDQIIIKLSTYSQN